MSGNVVLTAYLGLVVVFLLASYFFFPGARQKKGGLPKEVEEVRNLTLWMEREIQWLFKGLKALGELPVEDQEQVKHGSWPWGNPPWGNSWSPNGPTEREAKEFLYQRVQFFRKSLDSLEPRVRLELKEQLEKELQSPRSCMCCGGDLDLCGCHIDYEGPALESLIKELDKR